MRLADGTVYLDANATVPMCREAVEAFEEAERSSFANPSAPYPPGKTARETLERARNDILSKLGREGSLIFTGSGTEANHLAILSAAETRPEKRAVISAIEHPSCLELKKRLKSLGNSVEVLGVGTDGRADLDELAALLEKPASVVVMMSAHNETGVVQPVAAAARLCRERGVLFHTDAVQAFGKIKLPWGEDCPDTAAIAAHKIGGPKGIGALFFRKGTKIVPMLSGGGQEGGLRASTEAVPLAAAFAAAARAADVEAFARLAGVRDSLETGVAAVAPRADFHGSTAERLPNTSFFSVEGLDGRVLQQRLSEKGFYVGTGSACHGAGSEVPRVLREMGKGGASFPLRVSFSRATAPEEIEEFAGAFAEILKMI